MGARNIKSLYEKNNSVNSIHGFLQWLNNNNFYVKQALYKVPTVNNSKELNDFIRDLWDKFVKEESFSDDLSLSNINKFIIYASLEDVSKDEILQWLYFEYQPSALVNIFKGISSKILKEIEDIVVRLYGKGYTVYDILDKLDDRGLIVDDVADFEKNIELLWNIIPDIEDENKQKEVVLNNIRLDIDKLKNNDIEDDIIYENILKNYSLGEDLKSKVLAILQGKLKTKEEEQKEILDDIYDYIVTEEADIIKHMKEADDPQKEINRSYNRLIGTAISELGIFYSDVTSDIRETIRNKLLDLVK